MAASLRVGSPDPRLYPCPVDSPGDPPRAAEPTRRGTPPWPRVTGGPGVPRSPGLPARARRPARALRAGGDRVPLELPLGTGWVPRSRRVLRPLRLSHHDAARPRVPTGAGPSHWWRSGAGGRGVCSQHCCSSSSSWPGTPTATSSRGNATGIRADGIASLFYVANWRFILDEQSYFTLFSAASPLRHMWSLAIEEQFYIVWPLVVLGVLRIARGSTTVLARGVRRSGPSCSVVAHGHPYRVGDPSRAVLRHGHACPHAADRRAAGDRTAGVDSRRVPMRTA